MKLPTKQEAEERTWELVSRIKRLTVTANQIKATLQRDPTTVESAMPTVAVLARKILDTLHELRMLQSWRLEVPGYVLRKRLR